MDVRRRLPIAPFMWPGPVMDKSHPCSMDEPGDLVPSSPQRVIPDQQWSLRLDERQKQGERRKASKFPEFPIAFLPVSRLNRWTGRCSRKSRIRPYIVRLFYSYSLRAGTAASSLSGHRTPGTASKTTLAMPKLTQQPPGVVPARRRTEA